ncbi:MAG: arginine repressor [Firmicutes bacterium HGW-Firmicutes-1]|nr:MAG: arginine repressor [Firmicutes bacterium HGW-Firmicutes-1]
MKIERQSKILQLINEMDIETQEDLANKLLENGFLVTQATVSRDIRDLKLTKVTVSNGRQKYVVLPDKENNLSEKYIRVFRDGFLNMDRAENIIVLKTLTGMAMAVAAAIDAMDFEEVVGCIAGDDTIFCAVRAEANAVQVMERFNRIAHASN